MATHPTPEPESSLPDFTDSDAFKGSNLLVIGISPDSVEEQDAFVKKQKLTVNSFDTQQPVVGSHQVSRSTQF